MKATIQIKMNNAVFEVTPELELSRILKHLADKLENGLGNDRLYDVNGNYVGDLKITGRGK